MEINPMFFHKPSMTSTYDTSESIATPAPESDFDDDQIRDMLASSLCRREKQVLTDHECTTPSSHFRESAEKPAAVFSHKRKSSQDTFSDREGISSVHQTVQGKGKSFFRFSDSEEAARTVLEEQRDRQLAAAKSEILEQECKVDTLIVNFNDKLILIVSNWIA